MATRRERVILDLQDNLTPGLARAAVAATVLDKSLNRLGGTSTDAGDALDTTTASSNRLGTSTNRAGPEIDRFSGRLKAMLDVAVILGPTIAPLGAATIPLLTGSLMGLGAAASAIGVSVLALNGVGDALKSLDEYQLEPTAENLQKVRIEMDKLGPAGADFARFLDSIEGDLRTLQIAAREGLLPGLEEGIDTALQRLPGVRKIIREIAEGMGDLATSAGQDLAPGGDWDAFFLYLDSDAQPTLESFGNAIGDIANGLADMLVAFAPVTRDFTDGFESMAAAFADWSAGLDDSADFQAFLDYIRVNGPRALDFLGSLVMSLAAVAEAVAPIGAVSLPILTKLLDLLGLIAESPLGTPFYGAIVAITAYNRAMKGAAKASAWMTATGGAAGFGKKLGIAALAVGVYEFNDALYKSDRIIDSWTQQLEDGTFRIGTAREELAAFRDDLDSDSVPEFVKNLFDPDVWANTAANILGVRSPVDKLQSEVDFLGGKFGQTGDLADLFGAQVGLTGDQMRVAAGDAEQFSSSLAELDGWLSKRGAIRGYRESIGQLSKGLKDGFNREDRENIDATAESIARVAEQIKDKGLRADFLANARASLAAMAEKAAPKARREIERVIAKLDEFGLTTPPAPELDVDKTKADKKIKEAKRGIEQFDIMTGLASLDANANPFYGIFNPAQAAANNFERTYTARLSVIRTYKNVLSSGAPSPTPGTEEELFGGGRISGRGSSGGTKADLFYEVLKGASEAGASLQQLRKRLNEAEKAVDRERRQRDELVARRNEVRSAITNNLTNDLFGITGATEASGNPWEAGATPAQSGTMDPLAAAQDRRDRAQRFIAAIRALKQMGIRGGALQAIISEGLEAAEFMASQSQAYVSEFASTLAEANQYVTQAANVGATGVVSVAEMAEANKELKKVTEKLHDIERAIKKAEKANSQGHDRNADRVLTGITRVRDGHRRGKAYS